MLFMLFFFFFFSFHVSAELNKKKNPWKMPLLQCLHRNNKPACSIAKVDGTIKGTGSDECEIRPAGTKRVEQWIRIPLFLVESTSLYSPGEMKWGTGWTLAELRYVQVRWTHPQGAHGSFYCATPPLLTWLTCNKMRTNISWLPDSFPGRNRQ